ncbi:MAG: chorismate synthase [Planctomycetes bacterium]|nr:chorismate synthase [Planctomycetota bacterium]
MSRLSWQTAGESHGRGLVALLSGLPAGLELDVAQVDAELARRWRGYGRGGRAKLEEDHVELLAGLRGGKTLGSPLALVITNRDQTIEALPVPSNPRPGHADLAGCQKLLARDPRAVLERASARETAARVALGGFARQLLERFSIRVFAHVVELRGCAARAGFDTLERALERRAASDFAGLDPEVEATWRARVDEAKAAGDSLGGVFEVRACGLPPGLGAYVDPAERLTARLGAALFSIPAIKGVEVGLGFESARRPGSAVHDAIVRSGGDHARAYGRFARATNRAGGLEGGLTNGEELVLRAAMKPIPTLRQGLDTVDFETGEAVRATYQRSDVTSVPAASVVAEAVVALELARAFLDKFGGDSLGEVEAAFDHWRRAVADV